MFFKGFLFSQNYERGLKWDIKHQQEQPATNRHLLLQSRQKRNKKTGRIFPF